MATAEATSAKPAPDAEPDPTFDPTEEFPRPPDEDFWEKYSKRLEFPTSWVGAILVWVLMGLLYFAASKYLFNKGGGDVPVRIMEVGGLDDEGEGSAGSGGQIDPILEDNKAFETPPEVAPPPDLPTGKEQFTERLKELEKARRGQGNQKGRGFDNSAGTGPGGTGNDDKWKRGLGWTIRFKFADVREYTKQLAAAEAVVFVPDGGQDSKTGTLFADMNNPTVGRAAGTNDPEFSGRMVMYEQDPKKVRQMLNYLNVSREARLYGVYFSKDFQERLRQKEIGYRNRRPEDIENTTFVFISKGGEYEITVVDQKMKK